VNNKKLRCRLVFVALLGLLLALCAGAQGIGPPQNDAPNLVLLEVSLGQHLVSESLAGYQYGNDVFLPLGELSKLLTIAIRTQPVDGRASGYVLDEQRGFSLDVIQREVTINNKREVLDRSMVKLQADDIYVASRLLARWLPVNLEVELSSLTLRVYPREKLPLQARLERLDRGKQAGPRGRYEDPGYPRQRVPYRLVETPFIDQTLRTDLTRAHGKNQVDASYTAYLTADLMGTEAALFVSSNKRDPLPDLRLTLGRNDPDAGLLGPLRARTVMVGSIPVPGVANIALSSPTGNGVTVSNRPLNQPTRFDRHSLQGDLPPGWDVELYFNEALVAFQQSRPDGKYSFADQPLVYGANEFRLVFHGPLGQLRVERQSFLLESSLVTPGTLYYSLTEHQDEKGKTRSVAQFDYGLGRQLSVTGGMVHLPVFGVEQRYTNVGLHGYWQSFILSADLAKADNGGTLAQIGLKTRLGAMAVSASHSRATDFTSDVYQPSADPVRVRDEIRVDGALPLGLTMRLPVSLQAKRDKLASDAENLELTGRVSTYQFGTAVSNVVRWQSYLGVKSADGILQASRRVAGIGVTGQLQYSIEPQRALSGLAVAADKNLAAGYLLNLGVTRSFHDPQYRLTAALNKSLGSFGLGVNTYYSSRGEYGAGVQLFVAMGREPRQARWMTDAQPLASVGAASIRVFLDKNQNGVMDGDDEAIKDAGFTVNGGANMARTDGAGIAYLNRLPTRQNVDIALDTSSLEDPQWTVQQRGIRVVPRPGKVSMHEFAVSISGEIDGTTYMLVNGVKREAADLELELIDTSRKVVASTKSAADGYFVIAGVIPGDYLLRISRSQLKRLGLTDMGMHLLTITPEGALVNGREFYVATDPL
jgi:hypothetical protein